MDFSRFIIDSINYSAKSFYWSFEWLKWIFSFTDSRNKTVSNSISINVILLFMKIQRQNGFVLLNNSCIEYDKITKNNQNLFFFQEAYFVLFSLFAFVRNSNYLSLAAWKMFCSLNLKQHQDKNEEFCCSENSFAFWLLLWLLFGWNILRNAYSILQEAKQKQKQENEETELKKRKYSEQKQIFFSRFFLFCCRWCCCCLANEKYVFCCYCAFSPS